MLVLPVAYLKSFHLRSELQTVKELCDGTVKNEVGSGIEAAEPEAYLFQVSGAKAITHTWQRQNTANSAEGKMREGRQQTPGKKEK